MSQKARTNPPALRTKPGDPLSSMESGLSGTVMKPILEDLGQKKCQDVVDSVQESDAGLLHEEKSESTAKISYQFNKHSWRVL